MLLHRFVRCVERLRPQRLPISAPEDAALAATIRWPPGSPPPTLHRVRTTSCDSIAAQPGLMPAACSRLHDRVRRLHRSAPRAEASDASLFVGPRWHSAAEMSHPNASVLHLYDPLLYQRERILVHSDGAKRRHLCRRPAGLHPRYERPEVGVPWRDEPGGSDSTSGSPTTSVRSVTTSEDHPYTRTL
jgi:hypothetical protein